MGDGAPAHFAMTMQKWLEDHNVKRIESLASNLLDLNIIENLWSQMKYKQRKERTTSVAWLKRIARMVMSHITLLYLEKLYKSLPQCEAAVAAFYHDTPSTDRLRLTMKLFLFCQEIN